MEAKDRVMDREKIIEVKCEAIENEPIHTVPEMLVEIQLDAVAKAQAEISFKAGQTEERKKIMGTALDVLGALESGRKLGRYEVVEWGNEPCPHIKELLKRDCNICRKAKLEEWGIK